MVSYQARHNGGDARIPRISMRGAIKQKLLMPCDTTRVLRGVKLDMKCAVCGFNQLSQGEICQRQLKKKVDDLISLHTQRVHYTEEL